MTFTKEQVQQIEATAKEVLWPIVWTPLRARKHFEEKITPDVVLTLARMALAGMESEPVACIDQANLDYLKSGSDADVWPVSSSDADSVLLYAAPQPLTTSERAELENYRNAQQVVPDVMDDAGGVCCEVSYADGWNACRVAMLQGKADGNSPAVPDGWVMVPEEPTHEMLEAGDEQFGTYDVYRRMLSAAPQQEVK